jgi:deoxyribodipyrimidine photo-lyase
VDSADLVTGNISPEERDRCGYPAPIVDHTSAAPLQGKYQQQRARGEDVQGWVRAFISRFE